MSSGGDPMPMMVWAEEPTFVPPGEVGRIKDGDTIELLSAAGTYASERGLADGDVTFTLSLSRSGQELASHRFQMAASAGANVWLIADPSATEPNPSFTGAFFAALIALGAGEHELGVALSAESGGATEVINHGSLLLDGDSGSAAFSGLLAKFDDVEGARQAAVDEHMQEVAEADAREAAERAAEPDRLSFEISVYNQDTGHTQYVILRHLRTLSDTSQGVSPRDTVRLSLYRGATYELWTYDQDQRQDDARLVATLTDSLEGQTFTVG